MPKRVGEARWQGTLKEGQGTLRFGNGAFEGRYSAGSRFEEERGTNPEELIGAAHAGCFSMALSLGLTKAGFAPELVETRAEVYLEAGGGGFTIERIRLSTEVSATGLDEVRLRELAEEAKKGCPVSRALAGVDISVEPRLRPR